MIASIIEIGEKVAEIKMPAHWINLESSIEVYENAKASGAKKGYMVQLTDILTRAFTQAVMARTKTVLKRVSKLLLVGRMVEK